MKKGMLARSLVLAVGMMFLAFCFILTSLEVIQAASFGYHPFIYSGTTYGDCGTTATNNACYFKGTIAPIDIVTCDLNPVRPVPSSCYVRADGGAWQVVALSEGYMKYVPYMCPACYFTGYAPGKTVTLQFGAYFGTTEVLGASKTFTYDATAPSVSAGSGTVEWSKYQRCGIVSASDGGSGLKSVAYSWNSLPPNIATSNGASLCAPEGGAWLALSAYDNLDNWGSWGGGGASSQYNWEDNAPSVSASGNTGTWYNTQRSATVSASDTGGSGLYYVRYSWDSTSCGTTTSNGAVLNAPAGGHNLYLCASDYAYNTAAWGYGAYNWENTAPIVGTPSIYSGNVVGSYYNGPIRFYSSISDSGGSVLKSNSCVFKDAYGGTSPGTTQDGSYCYSNSWSPGTTIRPAFGVYDNANNYGESSWGTTYYYDSTAPTHDSITVSSPTWIIDGTSTYSITLKSTEAGVGFGGGYGILALINYQGSNAGNYGGYFSWHPYNYIHDSDKIACNGGGYASKQSASTYGGDKITLVSCTTSLSGSQQRTVTFNVKPKTNFPILSQNDISFLTSDLLGNARGWTNFDTNFGSYQCTGGDCCNTTTVQCYLKGW